MTDKTSAGSLGEPGGADNASHHQDKSPTMIDIPLAHLRITPDNRPEGHALDDHLTKVSALACEFANPFKAADWLAFAGLWHDLGKYRPGFQHYIRQANDIDAHIEGRVAGKDKTHSAAGALHAREHLTRTYGPEGQFVAHVLAYLIAGHHAGLDNWHGGLNERLAGEDAQRECRDALMAAPPQILAPELPLPSLATVPADQKASTPGSFALWLRMQFSCLVDADFLDTEAFMDGDRASRRNGFAPLTTLHERYDAYMARLVEAAADTPVNRLRANILRQCHSKADHPSGVFTLTVPTGGGKTLASLGFALRHAIAHDKRRIIYAIPYTSIIEQTADIFRAVLDDENVIEHHSNAELDDRQETARSRLACENWDAPVIVTTNVQLFESLFARRTSRCRKLHNLVGSVIVLDEAQLLPVDFLQPVLDVLRLLVQDYGVTLVLCTATQPALTHTQGFDARKDLRGFDPGAITEIIEDVPALYDALKRVHVHRPTDLNACEDWPTIADRMAARPAVLTIVNRRQDARDLHALLKARAPEGLFHLSALMCPQHRSDTIARIKTALTERRNALARGNTAAPVRVVSTQLVEAGVDLDFPVVFRAMAGLDSIAQAAGRCNREGRLAEGGEVHVFVPPSEPPPGLLRQARDTCKTLWQHHEAADPLGLPLFERFFRQLYADAGLDRKGICEMLRVDRGAVRFRDAAEAFRLIDNEDGGTVIVNYRRPGATESIDALVGKIERDGPNRALLRKLQRYGVTLYQRDIQRLLAGGDIRELGGCPGLYVQASDVFYDAELGANATGAPGDPSALAI